MWCLLWRYFNSRPHEEVDSFSSLLTFSEYVFQLTTSRGGRLLAAPLKIFTSAISTHDLTRRSTLCSFPLCFSFRYFNSRPHEEVDDFVSFREQIEVISTHDLTRRSTRIPFCPQYRREHFNSRPHEEVDFDEVALMPESFVFQLTTSRGGRRGCPSESRTGYSYFNSRPHEEVDQIPTKPKEYEDISTHDLTKRSTEAERIPVEDSDISTHDLTKRSTFSPFCVRIGHKIFQLTTSRRGRLNYVTSTKPYMVFQLTTSRRGRRQEARKKWLRDTFQLTTSRRGRRSSAPTVERGWVHFNSRPHEEVDENRIWN